MHRSIVSKLAPALLAATLLSGAAGCMFQSTPVTPAPLAEDEQKALRATLIGKWQWVGNAKPDGEVESQPLRTYFTFNGDGSFRHEAYGPIIVDKTYNWSLDGRNVVTSSPGVQTMRVESWKEKGRLRLFIYGLTTTAVLEQR